MDGHQLQLRETGQRSGDDQIMKCERRIERVAEHVVQIEMGQPFALSKPVRMHHDECAKQFGSGKKRTEFRVGQLLPIYVGQNLDALHFQIAHHIVELL